MKKFFVSLLLLCSIAVGAGYYLWMDIHKVMEQPVATNTAESFFIIKRGMSFNRLTAALKKQQLLENDLYFKLYAKYYRHGSKIKAGEYQIDAGSSPLALLKLFSSGQVVHHNITFIEGASIGELRTGLLKHASIIELQTSEMTEQQILQAIGAKEQKLEGLLLAETYRVERGTTDIALLKRAYQAMQQILDKQWQGRDQKLPYKNAYEALIMASIIEKETGAAQERPVIAGVFVNRMNIGMRLQTDPTVIYGMGKRYKGNITRADLRRPSAYNTYVINRLPPTPIATVGPEAIEAALNPVKTKYLYFVAKGDGSHYFSKSLREHNNAVRKYQLKRRKAYRSAPKN